jgi:hypothetical protein
VIEMASAKHYYGIFKYRTRIMTTGVDSSTDEKAIRVGCEESLRCNTAVEVRRWISPTDDVRIAVCKDGRVINKDLMYGKIHSKN